MSAEKAMSEVDWTYVAPRMVPYLICRPQISTVAFALRHRYRYHSRETPILQLVCSMSSDNLQHVSCYGGRACVRSSIVGPMGY